jgi:hypothetical protein
MLGGCGDVNRRDAPRTTAKPRTLVLREGAPVSLFLVSPISSDGSHEGDIVHFVVSSNVPTQLGVTGIPAGTVATAKVVRARGAGAISALANQPARLEIEFQPIRLANGLDVDLAIDAKPSCELTVANTTPRSGLVENETVRNSGDTTQILLGELAKALDSGQVPSDLAKKLSSDPEINRLLEGGSFANSKTWTGQSRTVESGLDALLRAAAEARHGKVDRIPTSEIGLALAAIEEIGALADSASDWLKGRLKGRNIRAGVGVVINAQVAKSVEWTEAAVPNSLIQP